MRFPRHAKIFRGQLDFAPLAGVLFLLVIFLLLTSLVYTPGIPVQLSMDQPGGPKTVSIAKSGDILYEREVYRLEDLEKLRTELRRLPAKSPLIVRVDAVAPREVVVRLREMARDLSLKFESAGAAIELPVTEPLPGVLNPSVVVAINLGEQLFYENQIVTESELQVRLKALVPKFSEALTLEVRADKAVPYEAIVRLSALAREAGVKQLLLVTRPRVFDRAPQARSPL
jgi:biopolymer transport protein ExbD